MRYFSAVAALAIADVAIAATSKCNADNCARAVTGTLRQQTASHFADCAAFMACTVTPAAVTTVVTATVPVTPAATTVTAGGYPENFNKRAVVSSFPPAGPASSAVTNCPSAVPTYASPCSGAMRYSSACSCFGATTSTVTVAPSTVTNTVTVTSVLPASVVAISPAAPSLCGNAGLQWAYFYDSQPDYTEADSVAYDPTYIKTYTPSMTGVTRNLHYKDSEGNVYGVDASNDFFTLEHRGYLFAPETGAYTFSVSNLDNNWLMWIGPQAYSGWTKANSQQESHLDLTNGYNGQTASNKFTMSLQAGNYYPIRMVYHNDRGPGSFNYAITAPSGYQLIGSDPSTAKSTPYVVQYSCDGETAPQYPPFGQET